MSDKSESFGFMHKLADMELEDARLMVRSLQTTEVATDDELDTMVAIGNRADHARRLRVLIIDIQVVDLERAKEE